jgi:hypothetical protein
MDRGLSGVPPLGVKFPLTVINIDENVESQINVAWLIIVIYWTEWELYDGGEIIDFESWCHEHQCFELLILRHDTSRAPVFCEYK